jgi:two-component system cell cycle response regulator CtrA
MDLEQRLKVLEGENEILRERIAELDRALIGEDPLPIEWRLTEHETIVMGVLLHRELATKDAIMTALYGGRVDDAAEAKIVDVFICKMRRKLAPFGIEIKTHWGQGYFIAAPAKASIARRRAATGVAA